MASPPVPELHSAQATVAGSHAAAAAAGAAAAAAPVCRSGRTDDKGSTHSAQVGHTTAAATADEAAPEMPVAVAVAVAEVAMSHKEPKRLPLCPVLVLVDTAGGKLTMGSGWSARSRKMTSAVADTHASTRSRQHKDTGI